MFSLILKYLKWNFQQNDSVKSEDEAREKFNKDLRMLRDDKESTQTLESFDETIPEMTLFCTQHEGVITHLNEDGGKINNKYKFDKSKALNFWSDVKKGSKVSFYIYKGKVGTIKLLNAGWDENYEENLKNANDIVTAGFNTYSRTVLGIVDKVVDGIIDIDVENEKISVRAEDNIEYMIGDNIKMKCITTDDEDKWNPTLGMLGNIVSIESISPNSSKQEVARVTAKFSDYAILDGLVILYFSCVKNHQNIELGDKFLYEAIETSVCHSGCDYNWRVIKLIKKFDQKENNIFEGSAKITINNEQFQLKKSNATVHKYINIFNKSDHKQSIKGCEITSNNNDLICLQSPNKKIDLDPFIGSAKIYITLKPLQYGIFEEELSVDFGVFKKRCFITLHVQNSNYNCRQRKSFGSDIIPGKKISKITRFIEIRIPEYQVCNRFSSEFDFKKKKSILIEEFNQNMDYQFLLEPLMEQNYLAKMRHCIYMEELAMEIYFEQYKIDRAHFENKNEFLRLPIDGVGEKRPSIGIGDSIHVKDPYVLEERQQVYEGIIYKVEKDAILVKFHSEFHSNHNRRDYSIEFYFSRSSFKKQQFAIDQVLSPKGLGIDFLYPKQEVFKRNVQLDVKLSDCGKIELNGRKHEFFNSSLNLYQKRAVVNVLRGEIRPIPYIIFGPPGTGKTRTVIECIEQIHNKIPWSRIIVATPSNSAANLIVEKLIESKECQCGDFVRFVSYNQIEKDAIPPHLKKYCATIDIGHDKGYSTNYAINDDSIRNISKSIIIKYKIYISTLNNLGTLMHIKFVQDHFTHVIIDEAGQAVEPEALIPITFISRNKGQVVMAGDPKQLGPVLVSQIAKHCGFDKSLLERLSEHKNYMPLYGPDGNQFDERFVTKLKKNYRSIPSILSIYSKLSYNNELEAEVNDESSREITLLKSLEDVLYNRQYANEKCGVFFINVNGRNLRTPESSSWFNYKEAAQVLGFVNRLKYLGISMKCVGIITPYALQAKKIREFIDNTMPGCGLKVGSVEEFQGHERDIILISTVRTNQNHLVKDQKFNLGFLQCPKRMNVAISRAKALLVVFGMESILSKDENWKYLIQYTREQGTYVT